MTQPKLRLILALGCFASAGAVAGLTWNHTVDANTYLDMARFASVGDWSAALNPFWGLSYGWLMGLFFHLIGPSAQQEVLAIRVTNVLIVLLVVASFDFLFTSMAEYRKKRSRSAASPLFGDLQICLLAYSLLLWSCFCGSWPALIGPDMLVTAIFFTLIALLLRVASGDRPVLNSALFGLALVAGYYTKAIYVPLGLLLVLCLAVLLLQRKKLWPAFPLAFVVVVTGCAPYYAAIARHTKGVPNAASLNYAWHVDGLWNFIHWHGEGEGFGAPIHPTEQMTYKLRSYSFAEPIHASYAPWYDPSYFYAGFKTPFAPAKLATALKENIVSFSREMAKKPLIWAVIVSAAGLLILSGSWRQSLRAGLGMWPVWLPSIAGFALYFAVHIEQRYVQAMVCCLLLVALFSLGVSRAAGSIAWKHALFSIIAVSAIVGTVLASVLIRTHHVVSYVSFANPVAPDRQWRLAQYLHRAGAAPLEKAAEIGEGMDCFWAFLARDRIIAEVPHDYDNNFNLGDADIFWAAPEAEQQEVLTAFQKAGASFVIADPPSHARPGPGWLPVEDTGYYYRALHPEAGPLSVPAPGDSKP